MNFKDLPWRPILAWFGAAVIAGVSLLIFFGDDTPLVEAVFYFPADDTVYELKGERRKIPRKNSREEFAALLVEEISLGPGDIHLYPLIPQPAEIRAAFLRDDVMYIDYSLEVLESYGLASAPIEVIVEAVRKTLDYNIPSLKKVIVTINGEELSEDDPAVD